jgi:hypothetical protein
VGMGNLVLSVEFWAVEVGVSAGAVRRPLGETKVTQVQIKESSVVKK